jgi:rhodanese-related sulfurtransferase
MSTRAARDLVSLGYTDVYNLVGGFTAWVEAGLPLAQ